MIKLASLKLEIDTSRISLKFHVHKYNVPQKINSLRKKIEVKKLLNVNMFSSKWPFSLPYGLEILSTSISSDEEFQIFSTTIFYD